MFKPCIDLRNGHVVQIVGGTLTDSGAETRTHFVSEKPPSWYANLYRQDLAIGGHVIALGPGNDNAAREALAAWPGGLQYGGGVTLDNAKNWLDAGASHVIVTSWVFHGGMLDHNRLDELVHRIGPQRLVLDLSCRRYGNEYRVVTDRWQKFTSLKVTSETLQQLSRHCAEFLVHAVDVEGLCSGIDAELVHLMSVNPVLPMTYAGGARDLQDLELVHTLSKGHVDLTIGSALDIFGGNGVRYADAIAFNRRIRAITPTITA